MPADQNIKNILVIGSGPIIIGQACEFDYSGTQACRVLKENGYKVVLINSNPATIMTDPETADEIYIEPIIPEVIKDICIRENIDSVLPTVGGQTGLNVVVEIAKTGFFKENHIQLIGADIDAIEKAEDRNQFKQAIQELGYKMSDAYYVYHVEEALQYLKKLDFPVIIRASYTLGGSGGAVAYNIEEYQSLVEKGLSLSMINEVVVEKSILGWKEYELEVMKDRKDNVVIICSIENIDPIGIHTGDSITVAPQQTLSDQEYQTLRDMSIAIIKKIGVATGGANIQFAVHPTTQEVLVIEMNPRVSRSSALASKATGFPIAKIAAKLAIGYSLDEIPNDITRSTPASFEPTLDYVVTKFPKFAFEKFSTSSPILGIQMKSVGETMSIGRTFRESFQKAIRGLEVGKPGFDGIIFSYTNIKHLSSIQLTAFIQEQKESILEETKNHVRNGHYQRIFFIKDLFYWGLDVKEIYELCQIDYWFLQELKGIFDLEQQYWKTSSSITKETLTMLKQNGFSDIQLGYFFSLTEDDIRKMRSSLQVSPVYKIVDTCAGEFEAQTPYYYSTYDDENELPPPTEKSKVVIIGGGPNRIGQGIEFDYMCVHASMALRKMGYEAVIINSNPETVSTDYDVSDMLFFEPLSLEDTLNIIETLKPLGVIVHYGGQTPLNLSQEFHRYNIPILGTSFHSIELTEDRKSFKNILQKLNFLQPDNETALSVEKAQQVCEKIGYPVLLRPSFVLGGARMKIVYDESELHEFFKYSMEVSQGHPVLIDKYLEKALEVDVDLISDGTSVIICGILEHIEEAGIHSGDSGCILPPQSISEEMTNTIIQQSTSIALELNIKGFMNIQFAIKDDKLFFLEINPRGSRTVPFISKATGIPWVQIATKVALNRHLSPDDLKLTFNKLKLDYVSVKEAVLPFDKFPDEDIILSPEMKSTGEVMGIGENMKEAFYKAQIAAKMDLPKQGGALISIKTKDVHHVLEACHILKELGFDLYATEGTQDYLKKNNIESIFVRKLREGSPNIKDHIINGKIHLIYNTPIGKQASHSDKYIRLLAKQYKISIFTEINGMIICSQAIKEFQQRKFKNYSIKQFHRQITL